MTESVSKEMIVSEVIEKWPLAADIMESFGLTCTGCSVNTMESIEAGAHGHGIQDDQIDTMVKEINEAIASGKAPERTEPKEVEQLKVTEKAIEKMKAILKEQGKEGWGIRVLVSAGGCAGFTYGMDFAEKAQEGDDTLSLNGLNLFVNKSSASLLSGVTVDFIDTLQESGFKFDNPNAKASCGCGKSFA